MIPVSCTYLKLIVLLVLQKLSTDLETQSRQLQRGKGSAVTFFIKIFKQNRRKF